MEYYYKRRFTPVKKQVMGGTNFNLSRFNSYKVYGERNNFPFKEADQVAAPLRAYLTINQNAQAVGIQSEADSAPRGEEHASQKIVIKKTCLCSME